MTPDMQERDRKAHDYVCTRFPNALEITHQESFKAGWDACASSAEDIVECLKRVDRTINSSPCECCDQGYDYRPCTCFDYLAEMEELRKSVPAALSSWASRNGGK